MNALNLTMGIDQPKKSEKDLNKSVKVLERTIEKYLPEFIKAVKGDVKTVVIHQDAFASGYDVDEYTLLGMAVKYAGLFNKEILFVGKNLETVNI